MVDYQGKERQPNNVLVNNSGKLIYNKCSDGENSVSNKSCRNNNIMGRSGDGDNVDGDDDDGDKSDKGD